MDEQIVQQLNRIWALVKDNSPFSQRSAASIATIASFGFPHSRFVDLKGVKEMGSIFCTSKVRFSEIVISELIRKFSPQMARSEHSTSMLRTSTTHS